MKVGYIQYDVTHDRNANFQKIESHLQQIDCDLVVLPELCLCGYLFESPEDLQKVAEEIPSGTGVLKMEALSQKYNCTLIFGMAEKDKGKIYNTAVVVSKGIYLGKYRKIHLSDLEKKFFERGDWNGVFQIDNWKIGVQICFDLWFPEISREQIRQGADLLCVLANFGGETTYHISKVRAIENLTPVVLCNRIGKESTAEIDADFLGKSSIIDAEGKRVQITDVNCEEAGCREIDLARPKANVICKNFQEEISFHYN